MDKLTPEQLLTTLFTENRQLSEQINRLQAELETHKKAKAQDLAQFYADLEEVKAQIVKTGNVVDRQSKVKTTKGSQYVIEYASLKQLLTIVTPILAAKNILLGQNLYDHPTDPDRSIIETRLFRGECELVSKLSIVSAFFQKKQGRSLTYFGADVSIVRRYALRVLFGITDPDEIPNSGNRVENEPNQIGTFALFEQAQEALTHAKTADEARKIMGALSKEQRAQLASFYNERIKALQG